MWGGLFFVKASKTFTKNCKRTRFCSCGIERHNQVLFDIFRNLKILDQFVKRRFGEVNILSKCES